MRSIGVRYLTVHRGKRGGTRYFWSPTKKLKEAGWRLTRLSDDFEKAIAEARDINRRLDAWRAGDVDARPSAPAPVSNDTQPKGIYVLQAADGPVKIGVTVNPASRMKALQTGTGAVIRLQFFMRLADGIAEQVEALAHQALSDKRLSGEWFDVPPSHAMQVILGLKPVQSLTLDR